MRPVRLSMTAFGPFAETEEIEFSDLGKNPLFLINGQTGSGKSTILDAICFALYHKTTGNEREAREMRCDYAAADTLTIVGFEFELAGNYYFIERMPEQERPKKRGEGFSKQAAKATLTKIEAGESSLIVAAKVREATEEIEQLLGLKVEQFRQVMVLPQGQFRKLLIADSKDREAIFSTLFDTGIYKKIEDVLYYKAKSVSVNRAKLVEQKTALLQHEGFESESSLLTSLNQIKPQNELAREQYKEKERLLLESDRKYQDAVALSHSFDLLAALQAKKNSLASQKEIIKQKRKLKESVEQALVLTPVFDEWQRRLKELDTLIEQILQTDKHLGQSTEELGQANNDKEQNIERIKTLDQLKIKQSELESLKKVLEKSSIVRKEKEASEKLYIKSQEKLVSINKKQEEIISKTDRLGKEKQSLEEVLLDQADLKLELNQLETGISNREKYDQSVRDIASLKESTLKIQQQLQQQKQICTEFGLHSKNLELAWHQGQAAVLASQLELNQPCPVCGSKEHPEPATEGELVPDEAECEAAKLKLKQSENQFSNTQSELQRLDIDLNNQCAREKELLQLLGDFHAQSAADLNRQREELTLLQKAADTSQQRLIVVNKLITQGNSELEKLLEQSKIVDDESKLKSEQFHRSAALLQNHLDELPKKYLDEEQLVNDIDRNQKNVLELEFRIQKADEDFQRLEKTIATFITQLETYHQQKETLGLAAQEAEASWQEALLKSSLKDEADFKQAILSQNMLDQLMEAITHYERAAQENKGAIEQQQNVLKDKSKPDLEKLQLDLEKAQQDKQLAEQSWQELNQHQTALIKSQTSLDQLNKQQGHLEEEYKVVGTLADIANGKTGGKISLQRFVLGVMLDEVLLQAGKRLLRMSKNRYQLHRERESGRSRGASGLNLVVEDAYSGKSRPVATLSGGESFLASLSLALGLSDVVQSRSGGIQLDTLFIDEGFGSLDGESLDLAVRTLIDLRNAGRMVGIISHVSELKEQIPQRLDVIKSPLGSSTRLVLN